MNNMDVLELLENLEFFAKKLTLALSYSGLRLPQYRAMLFLEKAGKITVSDLGKQQGITRATASVLVASLKKADLIDCVANKMDKRSFYIKLTDAGLMRLSLAKREVALVEEKFSQVVPEETIFALKNLTRLLKKKL